MNVDAKITRLIDAAAESGHPDLIRATRDLGNKMADWKREVNSPAIKQQEFDFIRAHNELNGDQLQVINDVLAGHAPRSTLTKEEAALLYDFESRYRDLAAKINDHAKANGSDGIDPSPTEVRPTTRTDPRLGNAPSSVLNAWDALWGQWKSGGKEQFSKQFKDYIDQNVWFADGEVRFKGKRPGYLEPGKPGWDARLSKVKSQASFDLWAAKEPSTMADLFPTFRDSKPGNFERIERELPYLRDTHAPSVHDFAKELTRMEREVASMDALGAGTREELAQIQAMAASLPESNAKSRLLGLIGNTGKEGTTSRNSVAGAVQEATGETTDLPMNSVARRLVGVSDALSPLAAQLQLVNPATPGAVNMAQMGANLGGVPLEVAGRTAMGYGKTFVGETPFDIDPNYSAGSRRLFGGFRGGSERMAGAVVEGVQKSFENNPRLFNDVIENEFSKRNFTDQQIEFLKRMQSLGKLDHPDAQRLLSSYSMYANEAINGVDHPSSKPSYTQGPWARTFLKYAGTPAQSAYNLAMGYTKGGPWHSPKNPIQNAQGIARSLISGGIIQPAATLITRSNPAVKAVALLAAGAPIPAILLGLRAYHAKEDSKNLTGAEIAAGRTLEQALQALDRAKDDADAGDYVKAILDVGPVASTGAHMFLPLRTDASTIMDEEGNNIDKAMGMKGSSFKQTTDGLAETFARVSPAVSIIPSLYQAGEKMSRTRVVKPQVGDVEVGGRTLSLLGARAPALLPLQKDFWVPGMQAYPRFDINITDTPTGPKNQDAYVPGIKYDKMNKRLDIPTGGVGRSVNDWLNTLLAK